MDKNILKKHVEKNVLMYFFLLTIMFSVVLITNKIYYRTINNVQMYNYTNNKKLKLHNNKISIIYLVDSVKLCKNTLLRLGEIYKLAESLNCKLYFLARKKEAKKLIKFFELNDINEEVYLASGFVFMEYSKGKGGTLLIFKRNRLIHSEVGCNDWNKLDKIKMLYRIIEEG